MRPERPTMRITKSSNDPLDKCKLQHAPDYLQGPSESEPGALGDADIAIAVNIYGHHSAQGITERGGLSRAFAPNQHFSESQ